MKQAWNRAEGEDEQCSQLPFWPDSTLLVDVSLW